jgi:outer membrane protein assembly factor BamB
MNYKSRFLALLIILFTLMAASPAWGAAGDLLWSKSFSFPGYANVSAGAQFSSSICIVSGIAFNSNTFTNSLAFIKVYDMSTGDLKWDRTLTLGANTNYFSPIIDGNVVYMTSTSQSYTFNPDPPYNQIFTLNRTVYGAYDANTGNPIWEKTKDNFMGGLSAANTAISQETNRVVLAGGDDSGNCIVEVYQANNTNLAPINSLLLNK